MNGVLLSEEPNGGGVILGPRGEVLVKVTNGDEPNAESRTLHRGDKTDGTEERTESGTSGDDSSETSGISGAESVTDATSVKSRPWYPRFMEALRTEGILTVACDNAGVSRVTVWRWRQRDPAFADEWEDAVRDGKGRTGDLVRSKALERVLNGDEEPIYHRGEKIGTKRRYPDLLTMALLNAYFPDEFRQRVSVETQGEIERDLQQLREELARRRIATPNQSPGGTEEPS